MTWASAFVRGVTRMSFAAMERRGRLAAMDGGSKGRDRDPEGGVEDCDGDGWDGFIIVTGRAIDGDVGGNNG